MRAHQWSAAFFTLTGVLNSEQTGRGEATSPCLDHVTTSSYQLNTLSRSSSFTWNVTLCGGRGSVVKYLGRRSCLDVKPAAALKSLSIFRTFFPSSVTPSAVRFVP